MGLGKGSGLVSEGFLSYFYFNTSYNNMRFMSKKIKNKLVRRMDIFIRAYYLISAFVIKIFFSPFYKKRTLNFSYSNNKAKKV